MYCARDRTISNKILFDKNFSTINNYRNIFLIRYIPTIDCIVIETF